MLRPKTYAKRTNDPTAIRTQVSQLLPCPREGTHCTTIGERKARGTAPCSYTLPRTVFAGCANRCTMGPMEGLHGRAEIKYVEKYGSTQAVSNQDRSVSIRIHPKIKLSKIKKGFGPTAIRTHPSSSQLLRESQFKFVGASSQVDSGFMALQSSSLFDTGCSPAFSGRNHV